MAHEKVMNADEIKKAMNNISLWQHNNTSIVREMVAENFPAVIGIVNAIAILAEKFEHHPDLYIYGWNKLRIELSTNEQRGLTVRDFELAEEIDKLKLDYFK
jgi:4a-hydroxytetrahydrobiopterin dehydratase